MLSLALTILWTADVINGDFFRDIYEAYKDKVYKGAYKLLQNHHDAEEVAQDVFFKIYRNIETFRGIPRDAFAPLIVIYTKNTALDYLRKKKRQTVGIAYEEDGVTKEHDILDPAPEPDAVVIDKEQVAQIGMYIESLPEKQRQVVLLRYKYNLSDKDIAKAMSMTEAAARSCICRARKNLRERMAEEKNERTERKQI